MAFIPVYDKTTGKKLAHEVEASRVQFFPNITSVAPAPVAQSRKESTSTTPASGETPKE